MFFYGKGITNKEYYYRYIKRAYEAKRIVLRDEYDRTRGKGEQLDSLKEGRMGNSVHGVQCSGEHKV